MRNFCIVLPALSLLNMGVNGATIANTLTTRGGSRTQNNALYKEMHSHQDRQIHTADFSSGPDADVAEVAAQAPAEQTAASPSYDTAAAAAAGHEAQPASSFKRLSDRAPHLTANESAPPASVSLQVDDGLKSRSHSGSGLYQINEHCEKDEGLGYFAESDSEPFSVSRGMREPRDSIGDAHVGQERTKYSINTGDEEKLLQELPSTKTSLTRRLKGVVARRALPNVPIPAISPPAVGLPATSPPAVDLPATSPPLNPAVDSHVGRRASGGNMRKLSTVEHSADTNLRRADAASHRSRALDATSRMVKVKVRRQDDADAADAEADTVTVPEDAAETVDEDSIDDLD